jgi:hypothetical protein
MFKYVTALNGNCYFPRVGELIGALRFTIVFLKVHLQLDESTPRYLSPRSVECCTSIYASATKASYLLEAFQLHISPIRATYPTSLIVIF